MFLSALTDAVSDQLPGESIGCYLSGGTDSSTVAGMVTQVTGRPVKTFSIGFDAAGYDEMEYARIAARRFGTDHTEYYITPADLVERIPYVASSFDQPFGNSSALPAFFCAKLAHDAGVTRMLAGDGGDELFGGNSRYATDKLFTAYEHVPDVLKRSLIEPLALGLPLSSVPLLRKGARYVEIAGLPVPGRMQLYNLLTRMGPANVFTPEFLAQIDTHEPHRRELATYAAILPAATLNRTLAYEWKYILADNDLPKVTERDRSAASTSGSPSRRPAARIFAWAATGGQGPRPQAPILLQGALSADSCRTRSSPRRSTASDCRSASGCCAIRRCGNSQGTPSTPLRPAASSSRRCPEPCSRSGSASMPVTMAKWSGF